MPGPVVQCQLRPRAPAGRRCLLRWSCEERTARRRARLRSPQPQRARQCRSRTSGPPRCTTMVCSNWATALPSAVRRVHPSSLLDHVGGRDGEERLDRQDQTFVEDGALAVVDARNRGPLVQPAPDAVPVEIADGAEAVAPGPALDRPPDVAAGVPPAGPPPWRRPGPASSPPGGGSRPGVTGPTATLIPVSEKYPSSSADTSRLTRSPARRCRDSEGTPCAASSFTLMQVDPGKR